MFNLQGSEIVFILLIALVVLGPEKLPGAIRRVTSLYAELRKLSSGFQDEFKSVLDEPLREMKSTADLMKNAVDPKRVFEEAEREAELAAAAEKKAQQARDTTSAMEAAGAAHLAGASEPAAQIVPDGDAFADPVDDDPGPAADVEHEADDEDDADEADGSERDTELEATPRLSSVNPDADVEEEREEKSA